MPLANQTTAQVRISKSVMIHLARTVWEEQKWTTYIKSIRDCPPHAGKITRIKTHHRHHQSLFIHEIVSFYMVFLGIVFKTRLKYSKELLTIMLKIQKLTLWIIRVTMGHGVLEKSFPWIEVLKTFKLGSFLISEGILFHRIDPL